MGPNQGSVIDASICFPISSVSNYVSMCKCILFWALVSIASSMKYQLPSCNFHSSKGSVPTVSTRTLYLSSFIHALRHIVGLHFGRSLLLAQDVCMHSEKQSMRTDCLHSDRITKLSA